jgi:hypothetical protein
MEAPAHDHPPRPYPFRTYLKKVFWPNLGVGAGFQILDILQYACGFKPGPAYTLDQNPFFEIGSTQPTVLMELKATRFKPLG